MHLQNIVYEWSRKLAGAYPYCRSVYASTVLHLGKQIISLESSENPRRFPHSQFNNFQCGNPTAIICTLQEGLDATYLLIMIMSASDGWNASFPFETAQNLKLNFSFFLSFT